ncbi:MAG TPA: glycosyltransferase family 4 protein [Chitinophagaceae bacterium]|nr:glycosyltransferase family 4 protein [Chitinophagaceae bacterium]
MKIVSTSYVNTHEYADPEKWLDRISFYTGLLEELAKQYQVESIEQINYEGIRKQNGVTYHFLNFKKKKLYFPFTLHRYIKNLRPDIVFVNGFVFPFQNIQLRKTLGQNVKIIVLHRAEKPFTGVKSYLQKIADRSIDGYLFVSAEFAEEWIKKGIIKSKKKIYEVIQSSSPFLPESKEVSKKILQLSGDPVFLWVGRLDKNKDPITVVKAFTRYLSIQPAARLYMIYQDDKLLTEVKDLINVDNKGGIILVGKVEHQLLQLWYNAADYFISGSHYEGSGIAVCEAMSCGCIPILTNIISFRRMTGPNKCGSLYEAGNAEHLLSVLLKTNEMNIEVERKKTLEQFNQELSFEAIAKKITKVITSINA